MFGAHRGGQCAADSPDPSSVSWITERSLVRSSPRAINWTKTEPTQRGNYSSQPYNSSCSPPPYYILCPSFFSLIALADPKEALEEQSRHSWKQTRLRGGGGALGSGRQNTKLHNEERLWCHLVNDFSAHAFQVFGGSLAVSCVSGLSMLEINFIISFSCPCGLLLVKLFATRHTNSVSHE